MNNQTIDTYNKIADTYDVNTADFWQSVPRAFLEKFIELSDEKVLDVGSGPGRDAVLLQKAGKEMTCIDASESMVSLCKNKGLDAQVANFENLPFEDGSFDAVWSYAALLHVSKDSIGRPFSEIHRVLRPSGIFALGMLEGDTEQYINGGEEGNSRWFSFYTKEEIEDLCQAHGFEKVFFDTFKISSSSYINFIFKKK